MKKLSRLLLFFFLLTAQSLFAQSSLSELLATMKDPRTPATTVDLLLPRLIALEKQEIQHPDSQQLALDIFQNASYAYARNFHFKQGLLVYQGYLGLKDRFARQDKSRAVKALLAQNQERRTRLDDEISQRKSEAGQLSSDTAYWEKMNGKFTRNYSLAVILFTAVLALILIRINMQAVKARKTLDANRSRMLEMQRLVVLGRFYNGAREQFRNAARELQEKSTALAGNSGNAGELQARIGEVMKKISQAESKADSIMTS